MIRLDRIAKGDSLFGWFLIQDAGWVGGQYGWLERIPWTFENV
jgi:hypothetical protein